MRKEIKENNFSETELKTIAILIRLGDSKELAETTVINDRDSKINNAEYYNAYCI